MKYHVRSTLPARTAKDQKIAGENRRTPRRKSQAVLHRYSRRSRVQWPMPEMIRESTSQRRSIRRPRLIVSRYINFIIRWICFNNCHIKCFEYKISDSCSLRRRNSKRSRPKARSADHHLPLPPAKLAKSYVSVIVRHLSATWVPDFTLSCKYIIQSKLEYWKWFPRFSLQIVIASQNTFFSSSFETQYFSRCRGPR